MNPVEQVNKALFDQAVDQANRAIALLEQSHALNIMYSELVCSQQETIAGYRKLVEAMQK